jgi:hypothetical protein
MCLEDTFIMTKILITRKLIALFTILSGPISPKKDLGKSSRIHAQASLCSKLSLAKAPQKRGMRRLVVCTAQHEQQEPLAH